MLNGVSEGRIVHYVLAKHDLSKEHEWSVGKHRPAIIVNSWPDLNRDDGYSNLLVFLDGSNDDENHELNMHAALGGREKNGIIRTPKFILWATSRSMSEGKEPGTWHWPEKI